MAIEDPDQAVRLAAVDAIEEQDGRDIIYGPQLIAVGSNLRLDITQPYNPFKL